MSPLVKISHELCERVKPLRFSHGVTHIYNPLEYAFAPHAQYLDKFGRGHKEVLLIGMNPGPFGMAQTGVPFGEISMVRDWMGISGKVLKPKQEHPKRPIDGFECKKSEVSGKRLWGWAEARFGSADHFFKRFFVMNYCPLVFMEQSGKNFTPDHLLASEREVLFAACDEALAKTVKLLKPTWVLGVGAFAMKRAEAALDPKKCVVSKILHPSPASPVANRGWARHIEKELKELGIKIP